MTIRLVQPRILSTLATAALLVIAPSAVAAASSAPGTVQLVIGFRAGATGAQMAAAESHAGATGLSTVPDLHARVVTVPAGAAAAALNGLRGQSTVAYAQTDGLSTPFSSPVTPNDPYFSGGLYGQEWGEVQDQANLAWSTTTGSPALTIAIIDSGVDPTSPDLVPNLVPGWNVLTNSSNTTDQYGHGTTVAGVAVAATNNAQGVSGYCWSCRLMPVEVYSNANNAYASNIASGITWAVDHGAQVINISLGSTSDSAVLESAIAYAESHNVIVVAAAGNYGSNVPVYPAASPGVISVGATDQNDALMSYSDFGSWVDVAAPSSQATTTAAGGYLMVGGTSMAAPAVAGIVGLMLSADPSATSAQIQSALFTSTNPVTGSEQVAYGRVNAANAVSAILGSPVTTSVPTNSSPPAVSGTTQSGETLTASSGSWSGSPTAYAYQWLRCSSSGCLPISGATSVKYVASAADVGNSLEASVTASNSAGDAVATSAPTALVVATSVAPANNSLPLVSGTAQAGQTLTASTGSWSGSPTAYEYQWMRCSSSGCSAISGATTSAYLEGSADVGSMLEVTVLASNSAGSGSATSVPTSIVAAASTGPSSGKPGKKK